MKALNQFISEKLIIKKDFKNQIHHNYFPRDKYELKDIIKQLLDERGKDADLNDIDVSKITDMSRLFYGLDPHNIDISEWDVSNVEKMNNMFFACNKFNCDLSKWDVSNVEKTSYMFNDCNNLQNIPSWYTE